MRIRLLCMIASAALAVAALLPSQFAVAEENAAARLLFQTPYLTQVEPRSVIEYNYSVTTTDEKKFGKAFTDTIRLKVAPEQTDASKRAVELDIFSGARERKIGPLPRTEGNPVLMVLLEQDTFELHRALGGQPAYFRNRIRAALRASATVSEETVDFEGAKTAAHRITITPYKGDANFAKVPDFANTVYEFVVADEVPGGFVSIASYVPSPEAGGKPLRNKLMSYSHLKKM